METPEKPKTVKQKLKEAEEFIQNQNQMIDNLVKGGNISQGRVQDAAVRIHELKLERNKAQNNLHNALGENEKLKAELGRSQEKVKSLLERLLKQKKVNVRLKRMMEFEDNDLVNQLRVRVRDVDNHSAELRDAAEEILSILTEHQQGVDKRIQED